MISPEKIAEMLAAAEKATAGPWYYLAPSDGWTAGIDQDPASTEGNAVVWVSDLDDEGFKRAEDAEYLSLCDPATITDILSELLTLRDERDANYDLWPDDPAPIADKAADHVFKDFAKALGLDTWNPQDGSESWGGDVWATAVRMLEDAGVLDRETGERPDWQSRALAAEAQLARQGEVLKPALDRLELFLNTYGDWPQFATRADIEDWRSTLSPEDSHG